MPDKTINECDECNVCQKNILNNSFKEDIHRLKMDLRKALLLLQDKEKNLEIIDENTKTNIKNMDKAFMEMTKYFNKIDFNFLL